MLFLSVISPKISNKTRKPVWHIMLQNMSYAIQTKRTHQNVLCSTETLRTRCILIAPARAGVVCLELLADTHPHVRSKLARRVLSRCDGCQRPSDQARSVTYMHELCGFFVPKLMNIQPPAKRPVAFKANAQTKSHPLTFSSFWHCWRVRLRSIWWRVFQLHWSTYICYMLAILNTYVQFECILK